MFRRGYIFHSPAWHDESAGKLFREACAPLIAKAYDGTLHTRLNKALCQVKDFDLISPRGKRYVANGLATAEGRVLLRGFDLNHRSPLHTVFPVLFALDALTGTLSIAGISADAPSVMPAHATHIGLQTLFLHIDFTAKRFETHFSAMETVSCNELGTALSLTASRPIQGGGTLFYIFLVEFRQEMNGILYALNDRTHNILHVIDLW